MSSLGELELIFGDIFSGYDSFRISVLFDGDDNGDHLNYYRVDLIDPNDNEISISCRFQANYANNVDDAGWELDVSDDDCWDDLDSDSVWSYIYFELMQRLERMKS